MTKRYERALAFLDFLMEGFYKNIENTQQKKLLKFLFLKNPAQKDLDDFLSEWDIEVAGAQQSLFLAYFMKKHPELEFPQYVKPRLDGLINFYRFKKIKVLEIFSKITKELNNEGIFPVAVGNIAIKCLDQNYSIDNISLIINPKNRKQVKEILKKCGVDFSASKSCFVVETKEAFPIKLFFEYDFDTCRYSGTFGISGNKMLCSRSSSGRVVVK